MFSRCYMYKLIPQNMILVVVDRLEFKYKHAYMEFHSIVSKTENNSNLISTFFGSRIHMSFRTVSRVNVFSITQHGSS